MGADHGVYLCGYFSALALWRYTELIKVSLLVRRILAELCPAGLDADDEEIRCPPTTHLVATVDDLTDMLDFDSEDIDGMDDDAGEEEETRPPGMSRARITMQPPPWPQPNGEIRATRT